MYVCMYFEDLAHMSVGASKFEIHSFYRLETQAGVNILVLRQNFHYCGKPQFCY